MNASVSTAKAVAPALKKQNYTNKKTLLSQSKEPVTLGARL